MPVDIWGMISAFCQEMVPLVFPSCAKTFSTCMTSALDPVALCQEGEGLEGAAAYGIRSGLYTGLHTSNLTCDEQERSLKWEYLGGIL